MGRIEKELSAVLADALARELDHDPDISVEDDERAQRATADELVREALRGGQVGDIKMMDLRSFSSGNTAMLVAQLDTTLSFVVKVDRSPDLVAEAHLLRRAATDPQLPESIRRAFPRIFAIDDEGPIYGYLMENLEDFHPLRTSLFDSDPDLMVRLLTGLWSGVLEPAYSATRSTRVVPNIIEDYFARAEQRLARAAADGLLPDGDEPLRIVSASGELVIKEGWGPVVERAGQRLVEVAPPFSTFVHGDPNPENVLWREEPDGSFTFRLIDPKNWWTGDYLFDVAKLAHYMRVTAPVEHHNMVSTQSSANGHVTIEYETDLLDGHGSAERALLDAVAQFAETSDTPDCRDWRIRYHLAVAANLLGIVGPRLARSSSDGSSGDKNLALIAFGEGLRLLTQDQSAVGAKP